MGEGFWMLCLSWEQQEPFLALQSFSSLTNVGQWCLWELNMFLSCMFEETDVQIALSRSESSAPLSEISFILSVQLWNNLVYFMMHSMFLNFTSLPLLIERTSRFSHLHWIVCFTSGRIEGLWKLDHCVVGWINFISHVHRALELSTTVSITVSSVLKQNNTCD